MLSALIYSLIFVVAFFLLRGPLGSSFKFHLVKGDVLGSSSRLCKIMSQKHKKSRVRQFKRLALCFSMENSELNLVNGLLSGNLSM